MADIESKYDLDVSNVLEGLEKVTGRLDLVHDLYGKIEKQNPFKGAIVSSERFEREMTDGLKTYAMSEQAIKELKAEYTKLAAEQVKIAKNQKDFVASAKYDKVKAELSKVEKELDKVNKQLDETNKKSKETNGGLGGMAKGFSLVKNAIQGFIALQAVQAVFNLGKSVFDTTAKFEKYEKILETALGSQQQAGQSMEALKKIAAETAFSMDELTAGYVKMVNRGLRPSTAEIVKLTDLAASQGKSFDQLVEAVLDAQTGEFERLKEFGIRASKAGSEVSLAFKGQTKEVKFTEQAIYDSIVAMGSMTGVAGQNAEMMTTLEGKTSNLGDSVDNLATKFGSVLRPVFEGILSSMSGGVNVLESLVDKFARLTGATSATEGSLADLNAEQARVAAMEGKLQPLLTRYDELKGKTTLNKQEQEELRKVVEEIQKIVPKAATAFDAYGKALDINKDKVRDYLVQNKELTKEMKLLASENIGKDLEKLSKQRAVLVGELAKGYEIVYEQGVKSERRLTNEQIVKRQIDLDNIKKKTIELKRALRGLDNPGAVNSSGELPTVGASMSDNVPVDKAALKREKDRLLKLEEDYNKDKLRLERDYGKALLETMSGDKIKYLAKKKELDKKEIDLEQQLYLAKKRAFFGEKAELSEDENKWYDGRRSAVDDLADMEANKFYADQANEQMNIQRQVTSVLSTEYQKQVQDLRNKYADMEEAAKKHGVSIVGLEEQKAKDLAKINLDNDLAKLGREADNQYEIAEQDILKAQIAGRVDLELAGRMRLLEIEKMYNEEKIKLIRSSGVEGAQAQASQIETQNLQIEAAAKDLSKKIAEAGKKFGPEYWINQIFGPELGKEMGPIFAQLQRNVSELYQQLLQQSQQRIARIDEEISKKEEQVDSEKKLNEDGVANNLQLRQEEMETLRSQRERAAKDNQRLQRAQILADSVTQASSMITASTKVFAALSGVGPLGVALAAGAVTAMFLAFGVAKAKALQATKVTQYRDGGRAGSKVSGPSHEDGGIDVTHEIEGGEWFINRKSSRKYDKLLEAINFNNEPAIKDYLLRDFMSGGNATMSYSQMKNMVQESAQIRQTLNAFDIDQLLELQDIKKELREIKSGTNRIPKKQKSLSGNKLVEFDGDNVTITELPE